jgi:TolB protein
LRSIPRSRLALAFVLLTTVLVSVVGCAPAASPSLPVVVAAVTLAQQPPAATPRGRIVFVAGGDLWEWHDGNVRKLTSGERFEGPAWSPDGDVLAASVVGVNHSDLVLVSPDGEVLTRLTDNRGRLRVQDSDWARMPTWAPDSTRIAFAADTRSLDMALWSIDPNGRGARQLYLPPNTFGGIDRPSWSPDGDEIAMVVWRPGPGQIEVLTPANGRTRVITQAANGAYDPAWSPDGQWIAHVIRDGSRHDVWIMRPDGSRATRVTSTGRNRMPTWSPDGHWLAWFSLAEVGFEIRVLPFNHDAEIVPSEGRVLVSGRPAEGPAGLTWAP